MSRNTRLRLKPATCTSSRFRMFSRPRNGTGRFLLTNVTAGHHEMVIDGRTAHRPNETYGVFEVGVNLVGGQTTVLEYTVWMPALDTAHAVKVPFPTTSEVVVTNPLLPGLEFHLPPNTTITDIDGKTATDISITPIPTRQPPDRKSTRLNSSHTVISYAVFC